MSGSGGTPSEDLPVPPPGSHWEIHGTPSAPWVWTTHTLWEYNTHGFAVSVKPLVFASAGAATAVVINEETGRPCFG